MTRYLLDTNHASTFWRKREAVAAKLHSAAGALIGLCVPSVGELWYMVFNSGRPEANAGELTVFIRDYEIWEYDADAGSRPNFEGRADQSRMLTRRLPLSRERMTSSCSPPTLTSPTSPV